MLISPPGSSASKNTYVGDACQVNKLLRTVRTVEKLCTSQDTEQALSTCTNRTANATLSSQIGSGWWAKSRRSVGRGTLLPAIETPPGLAVCLHRGDIQGRASIRQVPSGGFGR